MSVRRLKVIVRYRATGDASQNLVSRGLQHPTGLAGPAFQGDDLDSQGPCGDETRPVGATAVRIIEPSMPAR